jgi:hypothetical protein
LNEQCSGSVRSYGQIGVEKDYDYGDDDDDSDKITNPKVTLAPN